MFGLGFWELCVILLIALLVLGPKKLPDVATTLGKAIRGFRKATQDLQEQLDVDDEVKRPFQELKAALRNEPEPPKPAGAAVRKPDTPATSAPGGAISAPAASPATGAISAASASPATGAISAPSAEASVSAAETPAPKTADKA